MKIPVEIRNDMNLTLIFLLLICIQMRGFHCGVEEENSEETDSEESVKYTANSSESESEEHPPFRGLQPALELARVKKKNENKEKFDIRRDFIPMTETKNISELVYFCPAESFNQRHRSKRDKYRYCLYEKETSVAVLGSIRCSYQPEPKLWNFPDEQSTCGEDPQGKRYRFLHKVCWKRKSLLSKLPQVKEESDKILKMKRETVNVYSVCLQKLKNVLYLKYNLIVASERELRNVKDTYELHTKTDGFVKLDLEKWPKLFEEKKQKTFLKKIFGNEFKDVLIPQMLISPRHVKPTFAGHALHNYLNIKPQWKSVEKNWLELEYHLWKLGLKHSEGIVIYAGTYDYNTLSKTKKRKQIQFKIDDTTTQSIPFIWWKLIMNKDNEGIILAVQNNPIAETNPYSSEKLCKESICNSYGWGEINEIAYCCAFDEKQRHLLNLHTEEIKIIRTFNPKKHRSRFTKWLMKVLKL